MWHHFPLLLTGVRLLSSCTVVPAVIFWYPEKAGFFLAGIAVTDFFDGYYARRWNSCTALGAVLDPIADKCFVAASLISLAVVGRVLIWWVLLLLVRDIFVDGLRIYGAQRSLLISVSKSARAKTAVHMLLIIWLSSVQTSGSLVEQILIILALWLSLYSAYGYIKQVRHELFSSFSCMR